MDNVAMRDVVDSTFASPTSSEARSNIDHEIQPLIIVNDKLVYERLD